MAAKTEKNDWLNTMFAERENILVSGHETFTQRLGLPKETIVTLRWLGNRRAGYHLLFVVEVEAALWREVRDNLAASPLAKTLGNLFKDNIFTIFFDNGRYFAISKDGITFRKVNSAGLEAFFAGVNSDFTKDPGTNKAVNKSVNDIFQDWTRSHLSKFLTVNDIDVLDIERREIIELKRVEETVERWKPYLDEASQYRGLAQIAREINFNFRVFSYNVNDESKYGIHKIEEVSESHIIGETVVYNRTKDKLTDPERYRSTNRRQSNRNF